MLEVLITLHGQQYFAGPSTPRNLVAAWTEHRKAEQERQTERQRGLARPAPEAAKAGKSGGSPAPRARRSA